MMYPNVNMRSWISKYHLQIIKHDCDNCGEAMTVKAFISKDYAGIEGFCPCGKNKSNWASSVPISKQAIKEWDEIL